MTTMTKPAADPLWTPEHIARERITATTMRLKRGEGTDKKTRDGDYYRELAVAGLADRNGRQVALTVRYYARMTFGIGTGIKTTTRVDYALAGKRAGAHAVARIFKRS